MDQEFSFGTWIKKRRTLLGLTREALAKQVGYSFAMMRKIEDDERRPSLRAAELLAQALEIPQDQQEAFLRVARQERAVDELGPVDEEVSFPWQASSGPQTNLPLPATLFVGREAELAKLTSLMQDPTCRLVTLVGLAGIGKTRLALQAAHSQLDRFPHGVFFISLAPLTSHKMINATIANTIGLQLHGATGPREHLLNHLRDKRMLLVLDNFEHLIEGVGLLTAIMQAAPDIQFMVTSRERLNLQGEWAFDVEGLPYPGRRQDSSREEVATFAAVQLFLQGALRANSRFTLDEENRECVARICRLMEGLPLGIELAAAWVRVLSCQEIAGEIKRNLDFLKTSARDISERHRSMRAALDHSWNLLSGAEREALRRLSVFRGGFGREAAWEVAGASLEEMASLVDKSLVRRVGEDRYDLHELVRQYAAAHLQVDTEEYARTRDRNGNYYAALLEQWERQIRSPKQMEILAEIDSELSNIRLAWNWMVTHHQTANIQKSLRSLWHFHEIRARFWEGASLFGEGVVALSSGAEAETEAAAQSTMVRAQIQAQQGYFLAHLDRYDEAGDLLQQSLGLLRSVNDRAALAETLIYLAYVKCRLGALTEGSQFVQESLALNREMGNQLGIALGLIILSYIHLAQGAHEQAYQLSTESLTICRDVLGDPHGTADSLLGLSAAARHLRRYSEARQSAEEGLRISRALHDRWGVAQMLRQLGLISLHSGKLSHAEELFRESVSKAREVCDLTLMAMSLLGLAAAVRASRGEAESKPYLLEALKAAIDTKIIAVAQQALVEIASIEMREASNELALEMVLQIREEPSSRSDVIERAEQLRSELIMQLTPQQIEAIQARVQAKTLESLAQEILAAGE